MDESTLDYVWGVVILDHITGPDGEYGYAVVADLDEKGCDAIARAMMSSMVIGENWPVELKWLKDTVNTVTHDAKYKLPDKDAYEAQIRIGEYCYDLAVERIKVNAGYDEYRGDNDPAPAALKRGDQAFFAVDVDTVFGVYSSELTDLDGLCKPVTIE